MFNDLVHTLAHGSELRSVLSSLAGEWPAGSGAYRNFGSLDRHAYALWSNPERLAFPWHYRTDVLARLEESVAAHVVYRARYDSAPQTWALVGFNPALRKRLLNNLMSIESIPADERDADVQQIHCEIITAFRIEEQSLQRQAAQLQEFLSAAGCTILQVRGLNDKLAATRRGAFAPYALADCRDRLKEIIEQLFATTSVLLSQPTRDPDPALRRGGVGSSVAFYIEPNPRFELAPLLKTECELYLHAGFLDLRVDDLRRTIAAVCGVLTEQFCAHRYDTQRVSA